MRNVTFLHLVSFLALALHGCSHPVSTGAAPDPAGVAQAKAGVAASAAAHVVDLYKVPVDGLPSIGNPDALVTIVEFTDYECPYCQRAEQTLQKVRATYGDEVRVVVAELPLPFHALARPAALAAIAADQQGRFAAMHDQLFALAGALAEPSIHSAAVAAGLDMTRFEADRNAAPLAPSEDLGKRLGVQGTPSFFIGGRHVVGAQPFETLKEVIDERLAAAKSLVATGVRPRDVYAALTATGADHLAPAKDDGDDCAGGDGKECNDEPDGKPVIGDQIESVPVDGAPARGPSRASITIVSFGDFQCRFCAKAEATLKAVEAAHPNDVRVVFKNLPLPMHSGAHLAAVAALAADDQGRFWEFHDRLFAQQGGPLDRDALMKTAADLGLDTTRFARDLDDPDYAARVDRDAADATKLGVQGTPTFFVNGRRVVGAQPASTFEAAIARGTSR